MIMSMIDNWCCFVTEDGSHSSGGRYVTGADGGGRVSSRFSGSASGSGGGQSSYGGGGHSTSATNYGKQSQDWGAGASYGANVKSPDASMSSYRSTKTSVIPSALNTTTPSAADHSGNQIRIE